MMINSDKHTVWDRPAAEGSRHLFCLPVRPDGRPSSAQFPSAPGTWTFTKSAPAPPRRPRPRSRSPGLSGLGSPRGARARFSEGAYAIAAAQLRAGPLRRVNSGDRAAWVYSNAVDVTSSLRDVDGRKGSVSRLQNPSACSTGRAPGLGGCVQEGTGGRRGWRGQWRG